MTVYSAFSKKASEEKTMKIRTFLAWLLCFVMLLSGTASAETSESGWLDKGLGWIEEKTGIDTDSIKENMIGWMDTLGEFASDIKNDPEVQQAWNTLKDGALKAGATGKEAVTEAYHIVLNWWLENGESITGGFASALDGLAKAAGVDQADIADWYSTVEEYIAEHKDSVTSGVKDAWETIKEAGVEAGDAAREMLSEAAQTIQDWLDSLNDKEAKEAKEALGRIVNL